MMMLCLSQMTRNTKTDDIHPPQESSALNTTLLSHQQNPQLDPQSRASSVSYRARVPIPTEQWEDMRTSLRGLLGKNSPPRVESPFVLLSWSSCCYFDLLLTK